MQYQGHTLRHELKYYINASVYHTLRNRLRVVLKPDPNMKREDGYLISSLYFDDLHHSALNEKQSGIRFRKKYRMRCYDRSDALIKLECKYKYDEYISKTSATLSRAEYGRHSSKRLWLFGVAPGRGVPAAAGLSQSAASAAGGCGGVSAGSLRPAAGQCADHL